MKKNMFLSGRRSFNMGAKPNIYHARNKTVLSYIRYKHVLADNSDNDDVWFLISGKAQDIFIDKGVTEYFNLSSKKKN